MTGRGQQGPKRQRPHERPLRGILTSFHRQPRVVCCRLGQGTFAEAIRQLPRRAEDGTSGAGG
jgi:hypothetical protein